VELGGVPKNLSVYTPSPFAIAMKNEYRILVDTDYYYEYVLGSTCRWSLARIRAKPGPWCGSGIKIIIMDLEGNIGG
jgi:hypothetical protein